MNRLRTILLISGVVLVAAAIAGVAQPHLGRSATSSTGSTITVTGNGMVDSTPNQASFDFGVTTNGATAAQALNSNSAQARAIIDALKKAGIASSAIQTTQVSLWPQTRHHEVTGYQASNSVHVTATIGKSGALVDAAVGAGANNVDGPSVDTADKSALYDAALKKALLDAKGKAQAIADAAGISLGAPLKVHEGGSTPVVYAEQALRAAPVGAAPPVEAGTQQIQASVTVIYSTG